MKYNYVVFNSVHRSMWNNLEEDYYVICLKDLENKDGIIVNHYPLQDSTPFLRRIYNTLHTRFLHNRYWHLPFESIWYPHIFKNTFNDNKPICFVCLRYPPIDYLRYLKRTYPGCKIVKLSRDVIKIQTREYDVYSKAKIFDLWMSFDEGDCKKYGFPYFDEFESKIDIPVTGDYPIADVFFAGKAKDRFGRLLKIYDQLESKGVKCKFFILGAKEEEKVKRDGIEYATAPITYAEMLRLSVNSKCILEISQEDAVGYTSRFLEAVLFNKLLITDNAYIKKSKFYNPHYIQIINPDSDIDVSFFESHNQVDYHYNNEFSPINRLLLIDKLLEGKE